MRLESLVLFHERPFPQALSWLNHTLRNTKARCLLSIFVQWPRYAFATDELLAVIEAVQNRQAFPMLEKFTFDIARQAVPGSQNVDVAAIEALQATLTERFRDTEVNFTSR